MKGLKNSISILYTQTGGPLPPSFLPYSFRTCPPSTITWQCPPWYYTCTHAVKSHFKTSPVSRHAMAKVEMWTQETGLDFCLQCKLKSNKVWTADLFFYIRIKIWSQLVGHDFPSAVYLIIIKDIIIFDICPYLLHESKLRLHIDIDFQPFVSKRWNSF